MYQIFYYNDLEHFLFPFSAPVVQEGPREPPTGQMAALSMGAAGEGGLGGISGRSQQSRPSFGDPKTRPAHVVSKEGIVIALD